MLNATALKMVLSRELFYYTKTPIIELELIKFYYNTRLQNSTPKLSVPERVTSE